MKSTRQHQQILLKWITTKPSSSPSSSSLLIPFSHLNHFLEHQSQQYNQSSCLFSSNQLRYNSTFSTSTSTQQKQPPVIPSTTTTTTSSSSSSSSGHSRTNIDWKHFFEKYCADVPNSTLGNEFVHTFYIHFLQSCWRIRTNQRKIVYHHHHSQQQQQQNVSNDNQQQQQQLSMLMDWTHDFHYLTRDVRKEMDQRIQQYTLSMTQLLKMAQQQQQQQQQSSSSSSSSHLKKKQQEKSNVNNSEENKSSSFNHFTKMNIKTLKPEEIIKEINDKFHIVLQRFQTYTNDTIFAQFCRIMFGVCMMNEQLTHTSSSCDKLLKSIELKQSKKMMSNIIITSSSSASSSSSSSSSSDSSNDSDSEGLTMSAIQKQKQTQQDEYFLMKKVCNFFILKSRVWDALRQHAQLRSTINSILLSQKQQNNNNNNNSSSTGSSNTSSSSSTGGNEKQQQMTTLLLEQCQEQLKSLEKQLSLFASQSLNECIHNDPQLQEYYTLRITINLKIKNFALVLEDCASLSSIRQQIASMMTTSTTTANVDAIGSSAIVDQDDVLIYRALSYKGLAMQNKNDQAVRDSWLQKAVDAFGLCSEVLPNHLPHYFHSAAALFALNEPRAAIERMERAIYQMRVAPGTVADSKQDLFDIVFYYCRDILPASQWKTVQSELARAFGGVRLGATDEPTLKKLIDRIRIECMPYTV